MTAGSDERVLSLRSRADRDDLATFLGRAVRLDPAAVVRLRARGDERVELWTTTGFDVLATRVVAGRVRPTDATAAADALHAEVTGAGADVTNLDLGYSVDSSWRALLPPIEGFEHVDDVPVSVIDDLARRGADLAAVAGSRHGPPASLLDQAVIEVSGHSGAVSVPMRMVLALAAMTFAPDAPDEVVRVRATRTWVRVDARFGSVVRARGAGLSLSVQPR